MTLKQLRQLGLLLATSSVLLVGVALLLAEIHPGTWVEVVAIGVIALGALAATLLWARSAHLEARAYRQSRQLLTARTQSARPRARDVIRATGLSTSRSLSW